MKITHFACIVAATATVGFASAADQIVGTKAAKVRFKVPDPADPTRCIEVDYGEFAGRTGQGTGNVTTVAGWRKTYTGPDCCDSVHFLQLVLKDPLPPHWEDDRGDVHRIEEGEPYVDPLRGGSRQGTGVFVPADKSPFYDGERPKDSNARKWKSSETGDFTGGEQREYDMNDLNQGGVDWRGDPTLDRTYSDRVPRLKGLEFVTMVVCSHGKEICPIAGFRWGINNAGNAFIKEIEPGGAASGLTDAQVNDAMKRSGYGDFTFKKDCCPCVPEPSSFAALGAGLITLAARRRSRHGLTFPPNFGGKVRSRREPLTPNI